MATAQVVYSGVANGRDLTGTLFDGQKFWFSTRVPSRARFIEQVEANGGTVVKSEQDADIKIVDHLAKEAIPETYSYKYIEKSIRNGRLEDLDEHAIGLRAPTARPLSSVSRPGKQTRTAYTKEDDEFLWRWVFKYEARGMPSKGNEMFKPIEGKNDRHPWQSWRDRWIKTLQFRKPPPHIGRYVGADEESTPGCGRVGSPTDLAGDLSQRQRKEIPANRKSKEITDQNGRQAQSATRQKDSSSLQEDDPHAEGDEEQLLKVAKDVLDIDPSKLKQAWGGYSEQFPYRTPEEWQESSTKRVLSRYRASAAKANSFAASPRRSTPSSPHQRGSSSNNTLNTPAPASVQERSSKHGSGGVAATSSSFQPDTPMNQLRSTPGSQRQVILPDHSKTRTPQGGRPSSTRLTPSKRAVHVLPGSPKRKSMSGDEDEDSSLQGSRGATRLFKKPHQQAGYTDIREIPSTPDNSMGRASASVSSKRTLRTLTKSPMHSMLIDQEDEETEDEEEPTPIGGIVPSQSLSEPSQTPRPLPKQNLTFASPPPRLSSEKLSPSTSPEDSPFETAPTEPFETVTPQLPGFVSPSQSRSQAPVNEFDSEPIALDTQAILTTSTQIPDFAIAEPEGGWSAHETSPPGTAGAQQGPNLSTIDYSVASPPGGWEGTPSSSSRRNQSPGLQSLALPNPTSLTEWLVSRTSTGISHQQASTALMSTSMDPMLADVVLEHLRKRPGRGVPPMSGVWTEEDDMDLQGSDGRGIQRLFKKHGNEGVNARWEFLEKWRDS